jgi:MYXO-CTERM domain-containing protein
MRLRDVLLVGAVLCVGSVPAAANVILYSQNFDNPVGFVNNGADITQQSVNSLYANQPAGFTFSQAFTVETLLVGGSLANGGTGYLDPQGNGGAYALGMLSTVQDDLVGLAFDVGAYTFLNFRFDLSSIDLYCCGAPFVPAGAVPSARISLYDNPGGVAGLGTGAPLATAEVTGVAGLNKFTFNWTTHTVGLDASASTNGNVILRIDLLTGGYAALDNFVVAASDTSGVIPTVPEPAVLTLLALGAGLVLRRRARP